MSISHIWTLALCLSALFAFISCENKFHLTCKKKDTQEAGVFIAKCKENEVSINDFFYHKPKRHHGPMCCDYESNLNKHGIAILNKYSNCGKGIGSPDSDTHLSVYPWHALLRFDTPEKHFQCAGSLISDRYVLTAARCVTNKNIISIRLGEQNLDTDPDCESRRGKLRCMPPVEEFGIETIKHHPEYLGTSKDVALIKLNKSVVFKDHIRPICLPLTQNALEFSGTQFTIAGFGATTEGFRSTTLKRANLDYKSRNKCKRFYKSTSEAHICVQGQNELSYCHGDPGGPVFYDLHYTNRQHARSIQYGIMSSDFGQTYYINGTEQPVLLTNVAQLMPWITNNIID